jgi:hypothetical protein
MATTKLDILVLPTYSVETIGIADISVYVSPPIAPSINVTPPGFPSIELPFVPDDFNVFNSAILGITPIDQALQPLPDGIYFFRYSNAPAYLEYVDKSIMRVDRIQAKFDLAFMRLDMMECDGAIKTQASVTLNTINFFIQGSIAAANNCAQEESYKLYRKADSMLDKLISNNCGCSGNNYQINFY